MRLWRLGFLGLSMVALTGCSTFFTGGGFILALNGTDKTTFGFSVKCNNPVEQEECAPARINGTYHDPAAGRRLKFDGGAHLAARRRGRPTGRDGADRRPLAPHLWPRQHALELSAPGVHLRRGGHALVSPPRWPFFSGPWQLSALGTGWPLALPLAPLGGIGGLAVETTLRRLRTSPLA
jgi:hypothetical protein